jgi:hypothetical protein
MYGTSPDLVTQIQDKFWPVLQPKTICTLLEMIADEVERRGDKNLDIDPGETADWLRVEADIAKLASEVENHLRSTFELAPHQPKTTANKTT